MCVHICYMYIDMHTPSHNHSQVCVGYIFICACVYICTIKIVPGTQEMLCEKRKKGMLYVMLLLLLSLLFGNHKIF